MKNKLEVFSYNGAVPKIHKKAYIHPSAVIIGDVSIGDNCFIGPNVVLRGDNGKIDIRANSSVQDNCVVHSSTGYETILHEYSRVGHSAILHGCEIKSWAVIGMASVLLDGSIIEEYSLIGSMSFVKKGMLIPTKHLALGSPCVVKRELTVKEMEKNREVTMEYVGYPNTYFKTSRSVEPIYFDESN
jgi:carbonic anhydrase/acetyltransferase-like protein (isoleucine patch superfamily)